MPDKWSFFCLLATCFWIWFLLGYSVFAIAYSSYGMGLAKGSQCRSLDDAIWLGDTADALCDYLLFGNNNNNNDDNNDKTGINSTPTLAAAAAKPHCLATVQNRAASVVKVAESQCPGPTFALSPPWTRAFWSGVGLFACYWVLFGCILGAMAIEAWREESALGDDGVREMEGLDYDKNGGVNEGGRILLD